MKKILIVEDDPAIQELLLANLQKNGCMTRIVASGEQALLTVLEMNPDLILLDILLPGLNGLEVCQQLKAYYKTRDIPIIITSALTSRDNIVEGLQMGADDYVCKPFNMEVLLARIDAVIRRNKPEQKTTTDSDSAIAVHNLLIDPVRYKVKVNDEEKILTRMEFNILFQLAKGVGRVFTRKQLIDLGHDSDCDISKRSIDVLVVGLRRKIGSAGRLIETVRGVGYRLKEG